MITVHFAGLMYFDACRVDKRVLVPNAMTCGMGGHPPHYMSIWVDANRYEQDDWWDDATIVHRLPVVGDSGNEESILVYEFRVPERARLSFSAEPGQVEVVNLETGLPRLQTMCFTLDDDTPDTIAEMSLPRGRVEAFNFDGAGTVKWRISEHADPFVITATVGRRSRSITLQRYDNLITNPSPPLEAEGLEVVISNAPDFVNPHPRHHASHGDSDAPSHGHFAIYGKLDKDRKSQNLADPDLSMLDRLQDLEFHHGFLRFLINKPNIPDGECTPSCC